MSHQHARNPTRSVPTERMGNPCTKVGIIHAGFGVHPDRVPLCGKALHSRTKGWLWTDSQPDCPDCIEVITR